MPINQALLPEFDQEMANTRKLLERLPEDKWDYAPHPKSMIMRRLAGHVAELPGWTTFTLEKESLDIAPEGGMKYQPPKIEARQDVLDIFDKNVTAARSAIEKATDEQLMVNWSLLAGGHNIFTMPRVAVLRTMVMNHLIHHRAQLGVYLRLNDVAVPGMYGPSADEM